MILYSKFCRILLCLTMTSYWAADVYATDHNEPDYLNAIFSDVKPNASDLYGVFGFPQDGTEGKRVVAIMTFNPAPGVGKFNKEVLHRLLMVPGARLDVPDINDSPSVITDPIGSFGRVVDIIRKDAGEIGRNLGISSSTHLTEFRFRYGKNPEGVETSRVTIFSPQLPEQYRATGATFDVESGKITTYPTEHGDIKIFVGGRDDAFFTDLGGFFRSINYLPALEAPGVKGPDHCFPQDQAAREKGPLCPSFSVKTQPREANRIKSIVMLDNDGNFAKEGGKVRGVYNGSDSRAHLNANAIAVELPAALVHANNPALRQVRIWGEGYVRKPGGHLVNVPANRWIYLPTAKTECIFPNIDNKTYGISSIYLKFNSDRSQFTMGFKRAKFGFDQESPLVTLSSDVLNTRTKNDLGALASGKMANSDNGSIAYAMATENVLEKAFANAGSMTIRNCH